MLEDKIPTFEELILEAKEAGTGWVRDGYSGDVKCANGRCVLGAIIAKRGITEPAVERNEDGDVVSGYALNGSLNFPDERDAEVLLHIPLELALRVIEANDNGNTKDAELLDKLLGISNG